MPRFDPPHYLMEHDVLRAREAQHALVNARGHYLGAVSPLVAAGVRQGALTATALQLSPASKRDTIKANRAAIQAEANKVAPGLISVNTDGTLRINDPISAIDRALSSAFPDVVKAAIDSLPFAGPNAQTLKTKLKTRPLTFFLDVFDPAFDALRAALENVMTRGIDNTSAGFKNKTTKDTGRLGIGGFVYDLSTLPIPGLLNNPKVRNINVWLVQPGDELFDDNSRRLLLRMRMVTAYIVLFFKKPVELQAEIVRAGLEFLFGKPDDTLVRIGQGGDGSSFDKPRQVTQMPNVWHNGKDRRSIPKGPYLIAKYAAGTSAMLPKERDLADVTKLVWEIEQVNPKNQQRSFIQLTQRSWDSWRGQHRQLIETKLSEGRAINGLGDLGADPVATGTAKTTADTSTPVAGPSVLDQILAFLLKLGEVLAAISVPIVAIANAVNAPKLAEEKTKQVQAEADAARAAQEAAQFQAQSAGGVSPVLILGGLVVAALLLKKRNA